MRQLEINISESGVLVTQVNDNGTKETKCTDLANLISALGNQIDMDSGFLDPKVIRMARAGNQVQVVAFDKGCIRTVQYHQRDSRANPIREFTIPTPNTLFHITFRQLDNSRGYQAVSTRLFCIGDELVINDNTLLHRFPFSNVGGEGTVCWGNTRISEIPYQLHNGPSDIIALWWASRYNHDLDHGRHTLDLFGQLHEQETFPVDRLQRSSNPQRAGQIIQGGR